MTHFISMRYYMRNHIVQPYRKCKLHVVRFIETITRVKNIHLSSIPPREDCYRYSILRKLHTPQ